MMKDYTDITVILDESGSMSDLKNDVKGSMKKFIEEQKVMTGKCVLTLIKFATSISEIVPKNINEINEDIVYNPSGGTALLDAMGKAIKNAGERFDSMSEDEKPDKVIFVIFTDGEENSSMIYQHSQVMEMIKEQEEVYNWKFIYLGANQDAIAVGNSYGFSAANSMTYANNKVGLRNTVLNMSAHITEYRSSGDEESLCFNEQDRCSAMAEDDNFSSGSSSGASI